MSNHYHVVLHVDQKRAEDWKLIDVVNRWKQLYKGNMLVDRWLEEPGALSEEELKKVKECIENWLFLIDRHKNKKTRRFFC